MKDCPVREELASLLDGEATESRARMLRAHLSACASCRGDVERLQRVTADLGSSQGALGGESIDAFADGVLMRLDDARPATRRPRMWSFAFAAAFVFVGVAVAMGIVWRKAPQRDAPRDEWAARGGTPAVGSSDGARRVLLRFGRVAGSRFDALTEGATIHPHDVLAAEVGHTEQGPSFLLAFLVDADGERHWIYPAYELGASPPSAERLPAMDAPRILSTMTRLDEPAKGPARLVAIVLPTPQTVDGVEQTSASDLSWQRLAERYPAALVIETPVVVGEE